MIRVTHILEATLGGTARHLVDVGCGLAQAGFAVEAIVSLRRAEGWPAHAARLAAAGVYVTEVPMAREIAPASDAAALWRLFRHLRRTRPDVVHTHSSKAGILGRAAARLAGVPVIVHTPHAFAFQMRAGSTRRSLYRALERLAGRWTTAVVAVSRAEAELAATVVPPARVVVIENGIAPAAAAGPEEGRGARRELGIAEGAPAILFAGRLVEQKAPEVLVRAAAQVLASRPDACFLLAGDGPLRPDLQRQAEAAGRPGAIRLLGYRPDMPRLYAAADAFVLPSRWEGMPYALLEAMAAGLPVVASDIPPLREVLGELGRLAPPDDPDALAGALLAVLADPAGARRMGEAGRAHVAAHYTLARQVERLAALYRSLLGPAGPSAPARQNCETNAPRG